MRAPNIGTTSRPGHGQFDRTHSALDYVGKTPQWWTTGTPRRAGSRTQRPLGLSERVRRPTRTPQRRRRANIGSDDRANRGRRRTTWGYPLYDGQSSRQTERPAHTPATRLTCASATLAATDMCRQRGLSPLPCRERQLRRRYAYTTKSNDKLTTTRAMRDTIKQCLLITHGELHAHASPVS